MPKRTGLNQHTKELVGNCPQAPSDDRKTRDISAERAGFKSTDEARRVRTVIDEGTPGLVEAMDAGKVSASVAALDVVGGHRADVLAGGEGAAGAGTRETTRR